MVAIITINQAAISKTNNIEFCDVHSKTKAPGNASIIPDMIINDVPFPKPFSVIRSPSHIAKIVPAVNTKMPVNQKTEVDKFGATAFWCVINDKYPLPCTNVTATASKRVN